MQRKQAENNPKRRLSDYLKQVIQEQGLNLKVLADSIDAKHSSLRTEFNRNSFSTITLGKIFTYLKEKIGKLPPDLDQFANLPLGKMEPEQVENALAKQFEIIVTRPRIRSISAVDIKARAVVVSMLRERADHFASIQRFENEVDLLMGELKYGDAYFYMSIDVRPLEYEPRSFELRRIILESIKAGAKLHYLFPSPQLVQRLRERGLRGLSSNNWQKDFDIFQKSLEDDAKRHGGVNLNIENHVFYHTLSEDATPFLVPQHKFILFLNGKGKNIESYAVVPVDEGGLNLPLSKEFTNQFIAFLQNELRVMELWDYSLPMDSQKQAEGYRGSSMRQSKRREGKRIA